MADTHAIASFPNGLDSNSNERLEAGTWQTVEQAAVALGLSVRTVNRHISANKLKSRLTDSRREVFVPDQEAATSEAAPVDEPVPTPPPSDPPVSTVSVTAARPPSNQSNEQAPEPNITSNSFLDLDTALAMADEMGDRKADRQVELAVRAYQSLTQTIEGQAQSAKRTAAVAWCLVGILSVGVTVALVWTATRVTRAESESKQVKEQAGVDLQRVKTEADLDAQRVKTQADLDAQQLKERVDVAQRQADNQQKELADIRQKLSDAQERAARAEGRAAVYEEMQPSSRPSTRPTLIDRLTTAFGSGQ